MDLNLQRNDIERFLFDVRDYFRASLETSEYENTSNLFHMTASEATEKLLQRCEKLLEQTTVKRINGTQKISMVDCPGGRYPAIPTTAKAATTITINETNAIAAREQHEDVSYLDMTANLKKKLDSREFTSNEFNTSIESDKTFRCSTRNALNNNSSNGNGTTSEEIESDTDEDDDNDANNGGLFNRDPQIYDICQVSAADDLEDDERERAITPDLDLTHALDCPFLDLPAGHLAIKKSTKYGQLQRIEKRLFFDQSKKCYCGILNDWLLCYADGPTASRPSLTVHLKMPGIDIEHSGDGKRREICFQITTADPNKKFVFQANNEVDAKEWIHAIEAAIRGDPMLKNARKLPTPPVMKRMTFVSSSSNESGGSGCDIANTSAGDCIYEEPSPLYHIHEPTELLIGKSSGTAAERPELPNKLRDSLAMAKKYEYDVPKCPPQPLIAPPVEPSLASLTESETVGLLNTISEPISICNTNGLAAAQMSASRSSEKLEFQTKVKDVHSKLTSQLSAGTSPSERLKKASKKSYSCGANEIEAITLTTPPTSPPSLKEQKKQKKSNTPNSSPQKNHHNSSPNTCAEKSAKNWFLNRINKSASAARSSTISTPAKCKQSEKENLLNSLEMYDNFEGSSSPEAATSSNMKTPGGGGSGSCKSKVNMIINQFEASGAHLTMFSVEALASNAVASFSSFCESDCNNYEPIMTVSTPPSSFMKKV